MIKKYLFLLLLLGLFLTVVNAADEGPFKAKDSAHLILPRNPTNRQPPADVAAKLEKFFISMQQDKVEAGFKDLFEGNDQLQKRYNTGEFIGKTKQAIMIYGVSNGWELYDNRMVGARMMALTYFVYLKEVPLRWRFVFYSSDTKEWKLINMSVDDLLDQGLLYD